MMTHVGGARLHPEGVDYKVEQKALLNGPA